MFLQQRARFEIYQDAGRQYRFRLKASNGEIIAVSEAYTTKQSCEYGVSRVKQYAGAADVQDLTGGR